jgi:hypothetical protein
MVSPDVKPPSIVEIAISLASVLYRVVEVVRADQLLQVEPAAWQTAATAAWM